MRSIVMALSFVLSLSLASIAFSKQDTSSLKERASWTLEQLEKYQKGLKNEKAFYGLGEIVQKAHKEKNWDKVAFYAPLYLKEAEKYNTNWNYGNAIFEAHLALSHMSFEKNDKDLSRVHLIKASETPGSPQLDSFGPFIDVQTDYFIALAKAGEKESLIKFAENCKKFINKKNQKKMSPQELKNDQQAREHNLIVLNKFIDQIQNGKIPDFNP